MTMNGFYSEIDTNFCPRCGAEVEVNPRRHWDIPDHDCPVEREDEQ